MNDPRITAPRAGARPFAWPAGFGQRFTILVDTEEEFDWSVPLARHRPSVNATRALPAAARRFSDGGAALTYMVDYPVAVDAAAAEAVRGALAVGRGAVGAQLHPWVNPPHDEVVTPETSHAGNLPLALEAAKIDALDAALLGAFGARARIFRAGRYGVGPNTWRLLADRGYRLDSSMRAHYDYRGEGGPDFSAVGNDAFITPEGLIELPFTTVFTGVARRLGARLYPVARRLPHGPGILARSGLVSRVSLTPEAMPLAEAQEAIRRAVGDGLQLLNFAFHSPSLEPGHTPYVRDAAELAVFWRWWDAVLALLARLGVASASLDDLLAAAGD